MEVLWVAIAVAVCVAIGYLGYRIEPHHVSKDGLRFLGIGQTVATTGENAGRRREVWVRIMGDRQLEVQTKKMLRREITHWVLEGKAPAPPPRKAVYVLRTISNVGTVQRMTVKIPAKSRAVATMDSLLDPAAGSQDLATDSMNSPRGSDN